MEYCVRCGKTVPKEFFMGHTHVDELVSSRKPEDNQNSASGRSQGWKPFENRRAKRARSNDQSQGLRTNSFPPPGQYNQRKVVPVSYETSIVEPLINSCESASFDCCQFLLKVFRFFR